MILIDGRGYTGWMVPYLIFPQAAKELPVGAIAVSDQRVQRHRGASSQIEPDTAECGFEKTGQASLMDNVALKQPLNFFGYTGRTHMLH